MSGIAETDLFVLGSGILYQKIVGLEIDGLTLKKHSPDAFGLEHLLGSIGLAISLLYQHLGFGTAHDAVFMAKLRGFETTARDFHLDHFGCGAGSVVAQLVQSH